MSFSVSFNYRNAGLEKISLNKSKFAVNIRCDTNYLFLICCLIDYFMLIMSF